MEINRVLLLYNFSTERLKAVRTVTAPLGCVVKNVDKKACGQPVGALAGVKGISISAEKKPSEGFEDEFIVICGYSDAGLDVVLDALRKSGVGKTTLKAVLTETNAVWSGAELYREVRKEHELFSS